MNFLDFDFTPGEMLFYGGIAGMVVIAVISLIAVIVMSGSRKRLRRKLSDEYGERISR